MSLTQFATICLAHDVTAPAKLACQIEAANEDWQTSLDNDPAYIEWLESQAEMEEMRHARW